MCGGGGAALAARPPEMADGERCAGQRERRAAADGRTDEHCTHGNATSALLFKSRLTKLMEQVCFPARIFGPRQQKSAGRGLITISADGHQRRTTRKRTN